MRRPSLLQPDPKRDVRLDAVWPQIAESIDARHERMVRLRRLLHATPEPSNEEFDTTRTIAEVLTDAGVPFTLLKGKTGIVADIDLGACGPSRIALRAELDCVRVNDDKHVPYASTRPMLCHACGHDAHSTMVLAACLAVHAHRTALAELGFRHNFRAIFQPAEETATGARSVIQQGALNDVAAILALHVDPKIDVGRLGLRSGPITAAFKSFRITVRGRSGHSARPHEAVDPIPAAVNLVSLLYQLGPRTIDSRHALALTVASITAGVSFNAIPDQAVVLGTLRTTHTNDTETVRKRMEHIVEGVARATGCDIALEFVNWCPATANDPAIIEHMMTVCRDAVGEDSTVWLDLPSMGGEDFAFYQELVPGAILRLGVGSDAAHRWPLHSSRFDIDERCLGVGARVLARGGLSLALDVHEQRD